MWQPPLAAAATPAHATTKFEILGQRRFPVAVVKGGRTQACAHRSRNKLTSRVCRGDALTGAGKTLAQTARPSRTAQTVRPLIRSHPPGSDGLSARGRHRALQVYKAVIFLCLAIIPAGF